MARQLNLAGQSDPLLTCNSCSKEAFCPGFKENTVFLGYSTVEYEERSCRPCNPYTGAWVELSYGHDKYGVTACLPFIQRDLGSYAIGNVEAVDTMFENIGASTNDIITANRVIWSLLLLFIFWFMRFPLIGKIVTSIPTLFYKAAVPKRGRPRRAVANY